jgi:hypothetical protein
VCDSHDHGRLVDQAQTRTTLIQPQVASGKSC